jgi:hypothetical protein
MSFRQRQLMQNLQQLNFGPNWNDINSGGVRLLDKEFSP